MYLTGYVGGVTKKGPYQLLGFFSLKCFSLLKVGKRYDDSGLKRHFRVTPPM